MPNITFVRTLFDEPEYAQLNIYQRATLWELAILSPLSKSEAPAYLGNRESTLKSLLDLGLIAENRTHYVLCTHLLRMDNANARVAKHRESKALDAYYNEPSQMQPLTMEAIGSAVDEKVKVVRKPREVIEYERVATAYNEMLAGVVKIPQVANVNSIERKKSIEKAWKYFKDLNIAKGREPTSENIIKSMSSYFRFIAHDKDAWLRSENGWEATIEYILRQKTIDKIMDKIKTKQKERGDMNANS